MEQNKVNDGNSVGYSQLSLAGYRLQKVRYKLNLSKLN